MQYKFFDFEIKELKDNGVFEGYAVTFNKVDRGNDKIEPGAFKKTLKEKKKFPLHWYHNILEPVGEVELKEDSTGLKTYGDLVLEVQKAKELYALMRRTETVAKQLSIGYDALKFEYDGPIRVLKEIKLYEVSLVTFGMDQEAFITELKRSSEFSSKAEWDTAYINDLPNSAFAVIEPAYSSGDTDDKRARHLPHHGKGGGIDEPHLRNALARMNQIKPITDSISTEDLRAKASRHLIVHAKEEGIGDYASFDPGFETKPSTENHVCALSSKDHDKYRSAARKHEGKTYTVRYGRITGSDEWEEYEYFYSVDEWSASEARSHCKDHDGTFEAATGKSMDKILADIIGWETCCTHLDDNQATLATKAIEVLEALLVKSSEPPPGTRKDGKPPQAGDKPEDHLSSTFEEKQKLQKIFKGD